MIDKFQFDPVEGLQNATAYPDDPGNEEAFREQLQRPLNQVKDFVNSLVDAYAKTEAGRSGAEEIGSEAISGLMDPSNPLQPALTVRKQLQAAQKNIDDIIAGIIPDGSVDTEKIADGAVTPDKLSGGVGCNYIRNRIPTTGDNFDLGYKVGDTWTVPDMTLNNLIPHATAITPADWTLQNGSLAGSGSKGTITCGNGLESATAKISIAPIPGHVYALFGTLKVTSANVITSISLGADQKAAPVKDAAYNLCEIIVAPTEFKIQITAASAAALNGATVEFDKVCIVDMTADMIGVSFDRAGAIEYFSSHASFISQEPEYAGMNWYCKGSGVWQSSSQLTHETKDLYGVENVDDALIKLTPSAYLGSFGFEKHLKNTLGDVTFTENGDFPSDGVVVYNNLTISGGVTVGTLCPHRQIIIVVGTLILDGTINFAGKGGMGGASNGSANQGGAGGGVVVILANKILGTGQVLANGVDGGNANGSSLLVLAYAGVNGRIFNCVTNAGSRGSTDFSTPSSPGTAPVDKDLVKGGLYLSQLPAVDIGGAGGSSGTSSKNTSYTAGGGGGGAGTYGAGGSGGAGNTGNGGGAGGGGGLIAIVSPNPIPAISLSAKGGNGGNGGSVNAGGGGGGGGGQVIIVAPSSLAVTDVSGGIGGLKAGTGTGGNGVNGGSGLATFM